MPKAAKRGTHVPGLAAFERPHPGAPALLTERPTRAGPRGTTEQRGTV